jgi:hypothetical protein
METTDDKPSVDISIMAVQLPLFWAERPAVWFTQAEAQFTLASISSEQTKFCYVISQLDHRYAMEVEDIITSPPEQNPYSTLRAKLVRRLPSSREQRIRQLLMLEEMASASSPSFSDTSEASPQMCQPTSSAGIWSSRLPHNVQAILAGQPEGDLDTTDRIFEAAPHPALARVAPLPDSSTLLQRIKDLSRQVAAISAERAHPRSNSRAHLRSRSRDPGQLQEPPLGQQIPFPR